jgi:hypothetical protein
MPEFVKRTARAQIDTWEGAKGRGKGVVPDGEVVLVKLVVIGGGQL